MKKYIIITILLLISSIIFAGNEGFKILPDGTIKKYRIKADEIEKILEANPEAKFDKEKAYSYIKELASDDMQGRLSGFPSGEKAEEYAKNKYQEWGLEPAGDFNTYFHEFKLSTFQAKGPSSLSIEMEKDKWIDAEYFEDYQILSFSGSNKVEGEVVFVGYGIVDDELKIDDYKGINVKDKIVISLYGYPSKYSNGSVNPMEHFAIGQKVKNAYYRGAKGFIIIESNEARSGNIQGKYYTSKMPGIWVNWKVAMLLLNRGNMTAFQLVEDTKAGKNVSCNIDARVKMETNTDVKIDTKARNVVAKITGSDPKLKDEIVLIGAHLDHLGLDLNGQVFNGADDNASGSSVVLEVARAFSKLKIKPKRTVAFISFGAEELGLIGSKAFVENPPFGIKLENIVYHISMDMVGEGNGRVYMTGGESYTNEYEIAREYLPNFLEGQYNFNKIWMGGSDHYHFAEHGVPTFRIGSVGPHNFYHQYSDDYYFIQKDVLDNVGQSVYYTSYGMANYDKSLKRKYRFEDFCFSFANVSVYDEDITPSKLIENLESDKYNDADIFIIPLKSDYRNLIDEIAMWKASLEKYKDKFEFANSKNDINRIRGALKKVGVFKYDINNMSDNKNRLVNAEEISINEKKENDERNDNISILSSKKEIVNDENIKYKLNNLFNLGIVLFGVDNIDEDLEKNKVILKHISSSNYLIDISNVDLLNYDLIKDSLISKNVFMIKSIDDIDDKVIDFVKKSNLQLVILIKDSETNIAAKLIKLMNEINDDKLSFIFTKPLKEMSSAVVKALRSKGVKKWDDLRFKTVNYFQLKSLY